MFLCFDILTISPNLNLGSSLSLISLLELISVFHFTSTGFILIVLFYELSYLFTMLSNLSMYAFFSVEVMYL